LAKTNSGDLDDLKKQLRDMQEQLDRLAGKV
ncbi:MAG: polyhydroxyalkanoate synthesis repressor PhaR, partial [Methylobacteriaceae bacterium]|nr:polyhydroxyalkanoate synthesis repressor PhaR [Methylobacteriaceae bacterium]